MRVERQIYTKNLYLLGECNKIPQKLAPTTPHPHPSSPLLIVSPSPHSRNNQTVPTTLLFVPLSAQLSTHLQIRTFFQFVNIS